MRATAGTTAARSSTYSCSASTGCTIYSLSKKKQAEQVLPNLFD